MRIHLGQLDGDLRRRHRKAKEYRLGHHCEQRLRLLDRGKSHKRRVNRGFHRRRRGRIGEWAIVSVFIVTCPAPERRAVERLDRHVIEVRRAARQRCRLCQPRIDDIRLGARKAPIACDAVLIEDSRRGLFVDEVKAEHPGEVGIEREQKQLLNQAQVEVRSVCRRGGATQRHVRLECGGITLHEPYQLPAKNPQFFALFSCRTALRELQRSKAAERLLEIGLCNHARRRCGWIGRTVITGGHCSRVTGNVKGTRQHCHPSRPGSPQPGSPPLQGGAWPPPFPPPPLPPSPQQLEGNTSQAHSSKLPAPTTRMQDISRAAMRTRKPPLSTRTICLFETCSSLFASLQNVSMMTSSQPFAAQPATVTLSHARGGVATH